jgi:DNA-binding CsgD family transcriptional regulator
LSEIPPEAFYHRPSRRNYDILEILYEKRVKRTNFFPGRISQLPPCTTWLPEKSLKSEKNRQLITLWREHRQALDRAEREAAIDDHIQAEVDRRQSFMTHPRQPPIHHPLVTRQRRQFRQPRHAVVKKHLNEEEQIEIVRLDAEQKTSGQIARKLRISSNTIRTFLYRLKKNKRLHGKPGRPRKAPPPELVQDLTESVTLDPFETLRTAGGPRGLTPSNVKRIRNFAGIRFFRTVPVPALKAIHREKRVAFASRILSNETDERFGRTFRVPRYGMGRDTDRTY